MTWLWRGGTLLCHGRAFVSVLFSGKELAIEFTLTTIQQVWTGCLFFGALSLAADRGGLGVDPGRRVGPEPCVSGRGEKLTLTFERIRLRGRSRKFGTDLRRSALWQIFEHVLTACGSVRDGVSGATSDGLEAARIGVRSMRRMDDECLTKPSGARLATKGS